MPSPFTPPLITFLQDLVTAIDANTVAVQNLEAAVTAQAENLEISVNLQRYMAESMFGANTDIDGIWDGSDRYTQV